MAEWRDEVKIGLMILVSLVLLAVGITILGNYRLFHRGYILTVMLDNARGLSKGAPVTLKGIEIGKVKNIELKGNQVAVTVRIEHKIKLPVDSTAKLRNTGVMGGRCIEFQPGKSTEFLKKGDTLKGECEPEVTELATAAQMLTQRLQAVLQQLHSVLAQLDPQEINESFSSIKRAGELLQRTAQTSGQQIETTLRNLQALSKNLNDLANSPQMDSTLTALAQSSQDLKQITPVLQRSSRHLETILKGIDEGEGTLGKLAKQDSLYNNLQLLLQQLRALTEDIQKHPRRYIRVKIF